MTKPAALLVVAALALGAAANSADARIPAQWRNCKAVNARYPHGVGKVGAHDRTSGESVTNFQRSTKLYRLATGYIAGLEQPSRFRSTMRVVGAVDAVKCLVRLVPVWFGNRRPSPSHGPHRVCNRCNGLKGFSTTCGPFSPGRILR
jgi:hypothetical protein